MQKRVIIIGSGIGGLGAAVLLGKAGYRVTVLEKNEQFGGRVGLLKVPLNGDTQTTALQINEPQTDTIGKTQDSVHEQLVEPLEATTEDKADPSASQSDNFLFDAGPCWYLMPDVFEHFFELLGEKIKDHLELIPLAPSYRIFYKERGLMVDMFSDIERDLPTVEALEPGAGKALKKYLADSAKQYETIKARSMYRNRDPASDVLRSFGLGNSWKLNPFVSMESHAAEYFKSETMRQLIQYSTIFLGTNPYSTPAIYGILNHLDFTQGVYYPKGGMHMVTKALQSIGASYGVEYRSGSAVAKILVKQGRATGVRLKNGEELTANTVISNASTYHTEQDLLEPQYRTKSTSYWQRHKLAPSALIIHLGVRGKLPSLTHHNLLFAKNWQRNFAELFHYPQWPTDPSLYICNPSKTDPLRAPAGHEALSILVPVAANLDYNERILEAYANKVLSGIETSMKLENLSKRIVTKQLFCVKDFVKRYHTPNGTAFGSAHTIRQNNAFQSNVINKKVANLYYVGADSHAGIGLPGALTSSELMFKHIVGDKTSRPLKPEQLQ